MEFVYLSLLSRWRIVFHADLYIFNILFYLHTERAVVNNVLLNYQDYMINFESIRKSHFDLVCQHIRPHQVVSLILSDKHDDTPTLPTLFRSNNLLVYVH